MDPFMGEIKSFAGTFAPVDWHFCDGTLLNIADYPAIYSLLGTNFGGDGVKTFGLPDLRGRLPIGAGLGTGLSNRAFASHAGSEGVTLTTDNIPAHSHALNVSTATATDHLPSGKLFANSGANSFYATTPVAGSVAQTLNADTVTMSMEGGQAHENRMPTMAINYIICLVGMYPTQS